METKVLDKYDVILDEVLARVRITRTPTEFVPVYQLTFPKVEPTTQAILDDIREKMLTEMKIKPLEIMIPKEVKEIKKEFLRKSAELIEEELPHLAKRTQRILAGILTHESLGLGTIELLLHDKNLEEIVINNSKEPVWVYHITLGWLKTNIFIPNENDIYNYSAMIGRRVGSQITNLSPLMDAYMTTGDRANATLFPISSRGNTLTIRKFARRPWTVTDFIESKTLTPEMAAFLWLAIEYEINILVAGGTASGKTSLLNVLSCFIPPNHRIISIEETREIHIPEFLHWVPLTTRPPNPEGKGEISMLQLMINALRMRPDRVIVGEVRRAREAEVLFEAIHTGHSVYSTFHSNTAEETLRRLTNPPINIPVAMLDSLQLIVAMHRDRRKEVRRVLEVSEIIHVPETSGGIGLELNTIYRWMPSNDHIVSMNTPKRTADDIRLYTGMSDREMQTDQNEKIRIIKWFVKNNIKDIYKVAEIVSEYYVDRESILKRIKGK